MFDKKDHILTPCAGTYREEITEQDDVRRRGGNVTSYLPRFRWGIVVSLINKACAIITTLWSNTVCLRRTLVKKKNPKYFYDNEKWEKISKFNIF